MTTPPIILLIEDEPIIRLGTAAMLEDAGYRVLEAGDAREALELLASNSQIDIVLTDVQMPGAMDGLALVCMIQDTYPHVRSIVTSGKSGQQEARNSGATAFLPKPYTAHAVEAAVREILAA